VGITRYFDDAERKDSGGNLGIRGTAWFISTTSIVTAEHVAAAMRLSTESWKLVEIGDGQTRQSVPMRILRVAGPRTEKIAVLELRGPGSIARALEPRMQPLAPQERVVSLAYPANRQRLATGRFVEHGETGHLIGTDCSSCMMETIGSFWTMVPRVHLSWTARVKWLRWSPTSSQ
jgi:hypothetical protein